MDEVKWYENSSLESIKNIIKDNINTASRSFVAIGYYLKNVRDRELYLQDGYKNILEFAEGEFNISQSWANKWMRINDRFSKDGNSPMLLDEYKGFGSSVLAEMITLTDDQLEHITLTTTRAEIRSIKNEGKSDEILVAPAPVETEKELLSATGELKTVRPADSLITTPGCGNGEYDCFSCGRECTIRQVDRYCGEAPLGNPFSCTTMNVHENLRSDIGNKCMFINLDLAYRRPGDNEPSPCCKECTEKCGYECNSSAHRPVEDIIQKSDTETLKTVNEELKQPKEESHNGAWFVQQYFDRFTENLAALMRMCRESKSRSDVAKEFQKYISPYGARSTSCSEWDFSLHSFAGGMDFRIGNEKMHLKYGRLVEEALDLYNPFDHKYDGEKVNDTNESVTETAKTVNDEPENVIDQDKSVSQECTGCKLNGNSDAGIMECHPERGEHVCWIADETEESEIVEADVIHTETDNSDPERYSMVEVQMEIASHTRNLDILRKDNCTDPIRHKTKMRLDAATTLLDKLQESVIETESKPVQPELPILKNNDQRKDFIDNYTSWPIWIDQELTGERYYRYDFGDGKSFVVRVSLQHTYKNYNRTEKIGYTHEEYFLLGVKNKWIPGMPTFTESSSNKSAMIDFLREHQKKGA